MRSNPPANRERGLQRAVATYLDHLVKLHGILWQHPFNEGKRTPAQAGRAKAAGLKAGFPDIMIYHRMGMASGLAIELKVGTNKTTAAQSDVMKRLQYNGWCTAVCRSFDAARGIIDNYLQL